MHAALCMVTSPGYSTNCAYSLSSNQGTNQSWGLSSLAIACSSYSCAPGYYGSPSGLLRCNSDGTLSGSFSGCSNGKWLSGEDLHGGVSGG